MSDRLPRRSYDAEFKRNTAKLYLSGNKSLSSLSADLDIPESTLHKWVVTYREKGKESFTVKELSAEEREMLELKRQLLDVKMERDILKKALAIFSKKK